MGGAAGAVPLLSVHVRASATDLAARVCVFQQYRNDSDAPIEAKYALRRYAPLRTVTRRSKPITPSAAAHRYVPLRADRSQVRPLPFRTVTYRYARSYTVTPGTFPTPPRARRARRRYVTLHTVVHRYPRYVFPLDERAAVCGFEAYVNGKHVVSE